MNIFRDTYYKIKNRFVTKRWMVDTGFSRYSYHDITGIMLPVNMKMLEDFMENEKPGETIEWNSEPSHAHAWKEMNTIYEWWKNYSNRQKEIDVALDAWHDAKFGKTGDCTNILDKINEADTPLQKMLFDNIQKLEEKLCQEEEDMLIRLIKIRGFLWT